jgi:putative endonuclease
MFEWLKKYFNPGRLTAAAKGAFWERVAARELRRGGMKILARNWRRKGLKGELDIVADDAGALVFIEVRSRGAAALVSGYRSITPHKKAVLRQTALAYMAALGKKPRTYRFDVVEISHAATGGHQLHHYRNVPLFGK